MIIVILIVPLKVAKDHRISTARTVKGIEPNHRRRIDLEDKAKVVAYAWGTESLPR